MKQNNRKIFNKLLNTIYILSQKIKYEYYKIITVFSNYCNGIAVSAPGITQKILYSYWR